MKTKAVSFAALVTLLGVCAGVGSTLLHPVRHASAPDARKAEASLESRVGPALTPYQIGQARLLLQLAGASRVSRAFHVIGSDGFHLVCVYGQFRRRGGGAAQGWQAAEIGTEAGSSQLFSPTQACPLIARSADGRDYAAELSVGLDAPGGPRPPPLS